MNNIARVAKSKLSLFDFAFCLFYVNFCNKKIKIPKVLKKNAVIKFSKAWRNKEENMTNFNITKALLCANEGCNFIKSSEETTSSGGGEKKSILIFDENCSNLTYDSIQEDYETNTDAVNALLKKAREKSSKVKEAKNNANLKRINANGSKAISQEKYTYKRGNASIEGMLIKYEDGSLEFVDGIRRNGTSDLCIKFKNEEDFKANRPYQMVASSFKTNSKGEIIRGENKIPVQETHITNYEYTASGKLKRKETKNKQGILLVILENDNEGFLVSQKKYSSDGTLLSSKEATWEDENTRITLSKNGSGELQEKQVTKMKDKKLVSMSVYGKNDELKYEALYNDAGKKTSSKIYYNDGKTVKDEIEYFPEAGGFKSRKLYNKDGQLDHEYIADMVPDGKTWNKPSSQGTGDCYLLSSINAIKELSDGEKMLSDLIDIKTDENGKKTYTVTLPGAKIAAKSLQKDGLKVSITGTYTFTEEEFENIARKQGSKYSIGNANVILLEAAFEKYRQEVGKTAKDNSIKLDAATMGVVGIEGASGKLEGGLCFDATFVLTGKTSETYLVANTGRGLDKEALHRSEAVVISKNRSDVVSAGISSIDGNLTTDQEDMNNMLDKVMNDMKDGKKDVIATASFKIYVNGKESGGHAFTIKEVTKDTVTLINPWYPEKTITMARDEFVKTATQVTVSDTTKQTMPKEQKVTPNEPHKHVHKKENSIPGRPVTDADNRAINNLLSKFFGNKKFVTPKKNESKSGKITPQRHSKLSTQEKENAKRIIKRLITEGKK